MLTLTFKGCSIGEQPSYHAIITSEGLRRWLVPHCLVCQLAGKVGSPCHQSTACITNQKGLCHQCLDYQQRGVGSPCHHCLDHRPKRVRSPSLDYQPNGIGLNYTITYLNGVGSPCHHCLGYQQKGVGSPCHHCLGYQQKGVGSPCHHCLGYQQKGGGSPFMYNYVTTA